MKQKAGGLGPGARFETLAFARFTDDLGAIAKPELPKTNKDHAALGRSRTVRDSLGITEIAPLRIDGMFVLKGALKNKNFLAARMSMGGECAPWGVILTAIRIDPLEPVPSFRLI